MDRMRPPLRRDVRVHGAVRLPTACCTLPLEAAHAQYHDSVTNGAAPQYPTSLDDLLLDGRAGGPARRYLRKIYADPIMGSRDWGMVRVGGVIVGIYSKSE